MLDASTAPRELASTRFNLLDEVDRASTATDLARLARLLEQRKLVAPIGLEVSWQEIDRAIDALLSRTIAGKVVLHVPSTGAQDDAGAPVLGSS